MIGRDPAVILRALEFRDINEVGAVRLACVRRTPTDLRRMTIGLEAMIEADTPASLRRAENTFHIALGESSHNVLISRGLEDALAMLFVPYGQRINPVERQQRHGIRSELINAIAERQNDGAVALVHSILETERSIVRQFTRPA